MLSNLTCFVGDIDIMMESTLNDTSSVDDVFTWLNSNGFNDFSQSFCGM